MSEGISKPAPISTRAPARAETAETSNRLPENAKPVPELSPRDAKELIAEQEPTELGKAARAPELGRLGLKAGLENLEALLELAMKLHGTKP